MRLLEPLGASGTEVSSRAREERPARATAQDAASGELAAGAASGALADGAAIALRGLGVQAGGHVILRDVTIEIQPGEHVAIVGPSGAGKSTLVGVLLGWHAAARGEVLIDGEPLDESKLDDLRRETAWADPAVRLWNRSLVENLRYGGEGDGFGAAIDAALLKEVLETMPDGMQTPLGEGGGLVSGGEGQRVRLARAMMRPQARLVILDEPFRGVGRDDRNLLLRAMPSPVVAGHPPLRHPRRATDALVRSRRGSRTRSPGRERQTERPDRRSPPAGTPRSSTPTSARERRCGAGPVGGGCGSRADA